MNKGYKTELLHFNYREQNIKMLLYSNHLQLNEFCVSKKLNQIHSKICNNCSLYRVESIYHYLLKCPLYSEIRTIRDNTIKQIYTEYNKDKENKLKINYNKNNIKQMIFPPWNLETMQRIRIIKSTIYFIIKSKRFEQL